MFLIFFYFFKKKGTNECSFAAISGDFFIAKNLTIRNTAGPHGHQAVALRVTSFQSAFTWLSIEGYQVASISDVVFASGLQ
jgi:pectinesterase